MARFAFLDPSATGFYPDRSNAADTSVALLHTEAGRDPYDRGLTDLVGELSIRSETFRPVGRTRRTAAPHRRQALPAPRPRPARPRLRERTGPNYRAISINTGFESP
jgi:hypothetical protein